MAKVLNKYKDKMNSNSVYIGRPSRFGNPFVIGKDGDREAVIMKYEKWLRSNPSLIEDMVVNLKGKDLVCYCSPQACHGDVILKIIEEVVGNV
jgi:hypothetical protein